ncbi:hypothetical protein SAMN05660236_3983 [Ohtaekwangia koreensis]|uniref:Uncharacterized protein n=2 Tax=Ohtaekwangia koreensis TaxID=688867 RepID=A0A1T5M0M2_9BACT|nr:hypothetical protein SAMN05660236_3983 [Ohtaekwangia koreensis]
MSKGILKRERREHVQVLMLLLSILYIAGSLQFELLHSFIHRHELVITHSHDQEKDPCHRSIYHNDTQEGCEHDAHLIVSTKCQMCDLAFGGDQTILSYVVSAHGGFSTEYFEFYKLNLESYKAVLSSSRAPPTLA